MQDGMPESTEHARLYDGRYVCVMRRGHPLSLSPLTLDAYCSARHLLVSFSGRPFGYVDEALAALGRARRIVLTVNQFFTAGQVVAHSDLLTVLPAHFLPSTGIAASLAVARLPMDMSPVHVDLLWHRRQHARPAHVWLRQALIEAAAAVFGGEAAGGAAGAGTAGAGTAGATQAAIQPADGPTGEPAR
jgi:DNA-binding transcriptional LysR family regulator